MPDLRCPFCGTPSPQPLELEPGERYAYGCQQCGTIGPVEDNEEEAARSWDRRVDEDDFVTLPRKTLGMPWPPK